MYTCPAFAGKWVAAVVAKIWMNMVVCRCMNDCMFLWMNAFEMKCVWEPLQAGIVVCRCLAVWKHPPISVDTSICKCRVRGEGGALSLLRAPPFCCCRCCGSMNHWQLPCLPWTLRKERQGKTGKPRGQSITSWSFLQTPEIILR